MRAHVLSIAERAPAWVRAGFDEYARRLAQRLPIGLVELPLGPRGHNADLKRALADEGRRMQASIPRQSRVIALDGRGEAWSSEALARQLNAWMLEGRDLCFLIGGPDGLAPQCLMAAHQKWSLGPLTLPHALVRILLVEQIYRALSQLSNHPYHRAARPDSG
ncbi:MAG: 23S rRNA (pseudouridine(1915)-N(3))-methyltransferase RlmH [Xanthomonadales bacterium]|nr:23S rRNA (pseudouridine(1915)-N(3))-methyltransferase RlmH [Xanthomonadales bacterium]MCE7931743.1 23S rRNA (pseudouridine(1915)-N(3))-methyltransferase RlmH [Xanthomonadales bacterium PRO6]